MTPSATLQAAVVEHSGAINQDSTWSSADEHIVVGDVTIMPGVTLTVEPGATIKVSPLADSTASGVDGTRSEIIVQGSLLAVGREDAKTTFTSNAESPAVHDWQGIRVSGGTIHLAHSIVEYAHTGVDYRLSGIAEGRPIIEQSTFRHLFSSGIYIEAFNNAQVFPTVEGNAIHDIGDHGIHVYVYSAYYKSFVQGEYRRNTIHNTGRNGLFIDAYRGARHASTISENTVQNAGLANVYRQEAGIQVRAWTDQHSTLDLTDNEVSGSQAQGVYLIAGASTLGADQRLTVTATGNTLRDNGTQGLYALVDGGALPLRLQGSTVHNNGREGIYIDAYARQKQFDLVLVQNSIQENGGGGIRISDYAYTSSDGHALINAQLSLNSISNNTGAGVSLKIHTPARVVHNEIHGNANDGVLISSPSVSYVNFNSLDANLGYQIRSYNSSTAVDARYNWWGTTATAQMELGENPKNIAEIYDAYDSTSSGSVDYSSWLAAPLALQERPVSWVKSPTDGEVTKAVVYKIGGAASSPTEIDRVEVSTDGGVTWDAASGTLVWSYVWHVPPAEQAVEYHIRSRVITKDGQIESPGAGHRVTIDPSLPTTSGLMNSDESWSGDVAITGDVTVAAGATLTIAPGTIVRFPALTDDQVGGINSSRAELIIDGGALVVAGETENPVVLTSTADSPAAGDWDGIRVVNGGNIKLVNAVVEYAATGVDYKLADAVASAPLIEQSTFRHLSGAGVLIEASGGAQVSPVVRSNTLHAILLWGIRIYLRDANTFVDGQYTDNTVFETGRNGFYLYSAWQARHASVLSGNTVHTTGTANASNEQAGIHIREASGESSTLALMNNEVFASRTRGIYLWSMNTSRLSVTVKGNTLRDNLSEGLYADARAHLPLHIQDNTVHGNGGDGIYISAKGSSERFQIDPKLVQNTIYGNGGAGVRISDDNRDTVSYYNGPYYSLMRAELNLNTVRDNSGDGVRLYTYQPARVIHNDIHDNGGVGLYLDSKSVSYANFNNLYGNAATYDLFDNGSAVDARYNWWGDLVSAQMAAGQTENIDRIHDIHDDRTKGSVDYSSWFAGAITLQDVPVSWIKTPVEGTVTKAGLYRIEGAASSPEAIDRVEVSTDGGSTWRVAEGTLAWSYEWSVPIVTVATNFSILSRVVLADGSIQAPGATRVVTIDPNGKTISGVITTNEVWSGDVVLTGDLTVAEGASLSVQPGTRVFVSALQDDTRGGTDSSRIEIVIDGSIIVSGTADQPVSIVSHAALPSVQDWVGITVNGTLNFAHTRLSHGAYGIECHARAPPETECILSNSEISQQAGNAIHAYAADSNTARISVRNSVLKANGGRAISIAPEDNAGSAVHLEVVGNSITESAQEGVYVRSVGNPVSASIGNNSIAQTGGHGIFLRPTNTRFDVSIGSNQIESTAGGDGIHIHNAGQVNDSIYSISGNEILGAVNGLVYYNENSASQPSISNNRIQNAAQVGIDLKRAGTSTLVPLITGNIVVNSGTGLRLDTTQAVALPNHQFEGNQVADVYNAGAYDIDARGAWWGIATTDDLRSGTHPRNLANIYDKFDDASKGQVDYSEWLDLYKPPSPPVIQAPPSVIGAEPLTISGIKDADSGIWLNGTVLVPVSPETSWTAQVDLTEGANELTFVSFFESGLVSDPTTASVLRDSQAPRVFSSAPADGALLNRDVSQVEIILYEESTEIDAPASVAQATVTDSSGTVVLGQWFTDFNRLIFQASEPLASGDYTVTVHPTDAPVGNQTTAVVAFSIDTQPPGKVVLEPVPEVTRISPLLLSGSKEAGTSIYVNGSLAVPATEQVTWEYSLPLEQGGNEFSIVARDLAGNTSVPVTGSIIHDSIVPVIAGMQPANGSYSNIRPDVISVAVVDDTTGIDADATFPDAQVTNQSGAGIPGDWSLAGGNELIFTPAVVFIEGEYQVDLSVRDGAGNVTPFTGRFTHDPRPPALPGLDAVTSPTNSKTQVLRGTKEAESSVWIDGREVVPLGAATTWSHEVSLKSGENIFGISSRDRAGNQSGTVTATIHVDETPPLPVEELTADGGGAGTVVKLDWHGYDEALHGDVAGYRVYADTQLFTNVGALQPVAELPVGTFGYKVGGLVKGQRYFFAVVGYDIHGNANASVTPVSATPVDALPPEDVSGLRIESHTNRLQLAWTPSADSQGDLAGYRFYVDGAGSTELDKTVIVHELTGLQPATGYSIRITALDAEGNESAGVSAVGVTLLENPGGLAAEPFSGLVELNWVGVQPAEYVEHYAIYVGEADFSSVEGMSPRLIVSPNQAATRIAGLVNHTTYYFAITTVNLSDGEPKAVITVSATPVPDTVGPEIGTVNFNGAPLVSGATLTRAGDLTLAASDPSGVGRVEFLIDGSLRATDASGGPNYKARWDVAEVDDGAHTITVKAYDTLDNVTSVDVPVIVALAPPSAPAITKPQTGYLTNTATVTVSGTAEPKTEVLLYSGGVVVGEPVPTTAAGTFSAAFVLGEGENRLQAAARNRGGEGPLSGEVLVTLDSSIPNAPTGLAASARPAGVVKLSWSRSADSSVVGYDVYRSATSFETIGQAAKVNSGRVTGTSFDDLVASDGTWYYRIVAVNNLGTLSEASTQVSGASDSTAPRATEIIYTPSGNADPVSGRIAPGQVQVQVIVSEPLFTTPFLSITPTAGVPITLSLDAVNDTEYRGSFTITELTPSGTAYAVFSARDLVGNRGTEIDAGATLEIDAKGPSVQSLTISPAEPVRNDQNSPATINFALELDEPAAAGQAPELGYRLSGANRSEAVIDGLVQTDHRNWQGSVMLPADAGLVEVENLSFVYRGVDDLGNVSTRILPDNQFQVYQGDLPPLATPTGLTAVARPGGEIELSWDPVEEAVEYQLYRQAPGETELVAHQRSAVIEYVDTTALDGEYLYAVASIRKENAQEAVSGQSEPVTVGADSVAPPAPTELSLELISTGIVARWQAAAANEPVTYALYRAAGDIAMVDGLTPVRTGVAELQAVDSTPSQTEHTYAVVAVDAAGNMSSPSESAYLNFELLPVASLSVLQSGDEKPVVSWTHNGSSVVGYDLYLGEGAQRLKLNGTPLSTATYTDTGFNGDERLYTVVALDSNEVESVGRELLLPKLDLGLASGSRIKRGIMNRLDYQVRNDSTRRVDGVQLKVAIGGVQHVSQRFGLEPSETQTVPVIVGGYDALPDIATLSTAAVIMPNPGETVRIEGSQEIQVGDGALVLSLATQEFTRGGAGQVQFTLENTSEIETEIVLATGNGKKPSSEVRLKLVDGDGNVLGAQAVLQDVGSNVVRLANGTTVARIPAGASFSSDWFDLPVPGSAPESVSVRLEVDKFHYHLGREDHVAIAGLTANRDTPLVDTTYYGALDGITPESSFGDQDIVITGRAVERGAGQPMPSVPLKLVLAANGFERKFDVYTDATGVFSYTFKPLAGESGIYKVSVVHPDVLDRPQQGQFIINRVVFTPISFNVNVPYDYDQALSLTARAGEGTTASNLRLVYEAADQPSGSLPEGVQVSLGEPISLGSNQSGKLTLSLRGDDTAPETGTVILKVLSDESGANPLATVRVNYAFSEAVPALYYAPTYIETGVSQGGSVSESVTLENRGLAPLEDTTVKLVNTDGSSAPGWVYLTAPEQQGDIAVGEKRVIGLTAAPTDVVTDGIYEYRLRVSAGNHAMRDINVIVAVTQSGVGSVLFKASDIYTGTIDANEKKIDGLQGARIYVQNEQVLSVERTLITDASGLAEFTDLPAGWYKFRATATNHQEVRGRFQIKPGIILTRDVFLDYNLVSVEWSVTEITLQDRYEITLNTTYETQVPAAVVVAEPSSINLPKMAKGDVFLGEFTLANYGTIRADNLRVQLPPSDEYVRYELMAGIPTSLGAQERITVAFRAVALKSFDPATDGNATGGGCSTYRACFRTTYDYECANGTRADGGTSFCPLYTFGCTISGDSSSSSGGSSTINFVGGGGSGGSYTPTYQSISGTSCGPEGGCKQGGGCCPIGGGAGGPGGSGGPGGFGAGGLR